MKTVVLELFYKNDQCREHLETDTVTKGFNASATMAVAQAQANVSANTGSMSGTTHGTLTLTGASSSGDCFRHGSIRGASAYTLGENKNIGADFQGNAVTSNMTGWSGTAKAANTSSDGSTVNAAVAGAALKGADLHGSGLTSGASGFAQSASCLDFNVVGATTSGKALGHSHQTWSARGEAINANLTGLAANVGAVELDRSFSNAGGAALTATATGVSAQANLVNSTGNSLFSCDKSCLSATATGVKVGVKTCCVDLRADSGSCEWLEAVAIGAKATAEVGVKLVPDVPTPEAIAVGAVTTLTMFPLPPPPGGGAYAWVPNLFNEKESTGNDKDIPGKGSNGANERGPKGSELDPGTRPPQGSSSAPREAEKNRAENDNSKPSDLHPRAQNLVGKQETKPKRAQNAPDVNPSDRSDRKPVKEIVEPAMQNVGKVELPL